MLACCFFLFHRLLFLGLGSDALAEDANWSRHQIYSGSHVNSATAHDYDGDGDQEILFSAEGKFFMYFGPVYQESFIFAESKPKYAKMKPRCIHCVLHDVDGDGDLDFVGSFVGRCSGWNVLTKIQPPQSGNSFDHRPDIWCSLHSFLRY